MKFEGVCIIQESGFSFKFHGIPYDSCTHECNSYHAGVPAAVNPWQHCPHVHTVKLFFKLNVAKLLKQL